MTQENEPKPNLPDVIAMLDQAQTGLENIAMLLATYYKTLTRNGVEIELAGELTRDYQRILFTLRPPE